MERNLFEEYRRCHNCGKEYTVSQARIDAHGGLQCPYCRTSVPPVSRGPIKPTSGSRASLRKEAEYDWEIMVDRLQREMVEIVAMSGRIEELEFVHLDGEDTNPW